MSLLPNKKTKPKQNIHDLTMLIYSEPKAGKSTFCSQADNVLFLATEAGLNNLEVYQIAISKWEDLKNAANEIAQGKHNFKSIVIDTVDNAYRFCADYICKQNNIKHESELPYSKGYALVKNEFYRLLVKLSFLPQGLILVSHTQEREIDSRVGKYTKTVPNLSESIRKLILGMVDIIGFVDFEKEVLPDGKTIYNRVIRTKPSKHYEAGDRTGKLPEVLPLDYHIFEKSLKTALTSDHTKVVKTRINSEIKNPIKTENNKTATDNRVIITRK